MDPATLHVLLVEDSLLERTLLDEQLLRTTPAGHRITLSHAGSLAGALQCLAREPIDAVLLDLGLPDSDGLETISRLRAADPDVPIVVRTGLDDEHIGLETIRAGAFEFLVKGHADGPAIARSLRYAVEQRLATDALRRSEARFRALIENNTDAISLLHADGSLQFISRGITGILGYSPAAMCGADPFSFVHPDDLGIARATFAACLDSSGVAHHVRVRARHANGTYRVIAAIIVNRLGDNATNGIVANLRDITEEIALARQLAEQRAELEAFFEHAPVSLAIFDQELQYRYVNDMLARMNGLSRAEHVGKTPEDVVSPRLAAVIMPLLRDALRNGSLERQELEGRVHEGEEPRVVAMSAFSFVEPVTCAPRLAVILEDVTEPTRMRAALAAREAELRSILENAPDPIARFDRGLRHMFVNPVIERMSGISREAFLGRTPRELGMPVAMADRFETAARAVFATGEAEDVDLDLFGPDGVRHTLTRIAPEPARCRTPQTVLAVSRDVTELRNAQTQVREQLELQSNLRRGAEALLNTLSVTEVAERVVSVCTIGFGVGGAWVGAACPDGTIEELATINDPHFHSLPWPRSDEEGDLRPTDAAISTRQSVICNDIAQDPAHARFLDTARKVGAQSCMALPLISRERVFGAMAVYSTQLNYFTPSRVQALETFAHHAASALENARLYETLARELSERGCLEDQFRQAQKMEAVGRLAGGVAHDFNNLLTAMIGYTELVKEGMPPGSQAVSDLNEVLAAAHRAAALTRQLLAFGRRQLLMPEVLPLGTVVRGMERMLQPLLGEDIDLVISEAPDVPPVFADRGQLEQVVMNLVVNARDAMPDGGRLAIDIAFASAPDGASQERWVALAVSDSGCGMDHETLSKIFEPFFTTKGRGKGTGLGLSTVYGIVRQSGGHISVQSDPGRGTTFRILFRAADENSAGSAGGVAVACGKH